MNSDRELRGGAGRLPSVTSFDRPGRGRLAVVATTWLGATLIGLGVALGRPVGPVVLRLSTNHGVHLGDLAAFGVAYLLAVAVSVTLLRR